MERMILNIHTIHGTIVRIFTLHEKHNNQRFSCRICMQKSPIGMVWVFNSPSNLGAPKTRSPGMFEGEGGKSINASEIFFHLKFT